MPFPHNSKNVSTEGPKKPVLPKERYVLSIFDAKETTSKKGDPMIELDVKVIEHAVYQDHDLKHWVVFIPAGKKGDWVNVHFRKCIGVPHGGEDIVDASQWVGKKFEADVDIDTKPYTNKKGEVKTDPRNAIVRVYPYKDIFPEVEASTANEKDSEIPF
jgi:hypothetical protein